MKLLITILCFVFALQGYSQKAKFKELKLNASKKYYTTKEPTIIFPIVTTSNQKIDKIINTQIKNDVLKPDNEKNLKSVLLENIEDYGLTDVSYEITYNSDNFLSFSVLSQGCGAYCSSTTTHFNFDLSTGKKISIYDLIIKSKIDSFKNIVQSDKIKSLKKYKVGARNLIGADGIDSSTYTWILSQVDDDCINQISIENFAVSRNALEIFDPCEFPHAIQSQEPEIELKYQFSSINKILTRRFKIMFQ